VTPRDVLIMDMDPALIRLLREVLEKEGYRVNAAVQGAGAGEATEPPTPGIVFAGSGNQPVDVPWHVLEALEDGVIHIDEGIRIRWLNSAAAGHFGLSKSDAPGLEVTELLEASSMEPLKEILRAAWNGTHVPLRVVTRNATPLDLRITQMESGRINGIPGRFLITRTPSDELETRHEALRKRRELELLSDLLRDARSRRPLEEVLPAFLERAVELLDSEAGTVAVLEMEDGALGHLAFKYTVGEKAEAVRSIYIPSGRGVIGWCVSNNETAIVNDVGEDPRFFSWVDEISGFKTRSVMCLPICPEGEVIGAIEVINKRNGPFTEQDLHFLRTCTHAATVNMQAALVQQRLVVQRDYYSGILNTLKQGVLVLERDLSVRDVNQSLAMFLNRDRADILGAKCHKIFHNRDEPCAECTLDRFDIFDSGRDFCASREFPDARGEAVRFRVSGTPLEVRDEIVTSIILTFDDEIAPAPCARGLPESADAGRRDPGESGQRQDAAATLIDGMSNAFNNLLAGIMANCQLVSMKFRDVPELARYNEEIIKWTRSGVELINGLNLLTRRDAGADYSRLNLTEVLEDLRKTMRSIFDKRVEIRTAWPDVLPVHGSASSLARALVNVCHNARDAMPDGGILTLAAEMNDNRITVRITDSGTGMNESIAARAFEPFFSTKPTGKGVGLGLSTAREIVRRHGGEIRIKTEPRRGSTFEFVLPAAGPEDPAEADPKRPG